MQSCVLNVVCGVYHFDSGEGGAIAFAVYSRKNLMVEIVYNNMNCMMAQSDVYWFTG